MEERIERRKLPDQVIDRLLALIESGELRPGDRLPSERELVARYGVGRPAVREALQSLEKMGLIEIRHGDRARMTSPGPRSLFDLVDRSARHLLRTCPQTVEELSEARLAFETGMVRLAVRRADSADLERLEKALEKLRESAGDPRAFVASDMAFHAAIACFSKNSIYAALGEFMLSWLFERYPGMISVPGAEALAIAEHRAIYERIAARDEEGAVNALTAHLTRANPLYARYVSAPTASPGAEAG